MDTEWLGEDRCPAWNDDEHARWLEQWAPPCPIGNPQRLCRLLAYREREPGRLQLRVAIRPATDGICEAIVREHADRVEVRVLACYEDEDDEDQTVDCEYWDCPTHVYLESPLNGRAVIDIDSLAPLPLHVPSCTAAPAPRTEDPEHGA